MGALPPVLKPLKTLLQARSGSSLFSQLGLARLGQFNDEVQLYNGFVRAVPVTLPQVFFDTLGKMLPQGGQSALQVLQSPNLLVKGQPAAAVPWQGLMLPVNKALLADALGNQRQLWQRLKAQGVPLRGDWFVLPEPDFLPPEANTSRSWQVPPKPWGTVLEEARGTWLERFRNPNVWPQARGLPTAGSRWQWFNALRDQLQAYGSKVDVLVCAPRTLVDFALYVSQQAGRFVPLVELVPHLKVLVFTHYDLGLQRTELRYLLQGLSHVRWVQASFMPTGLMMTQADINIRQRQELDLGGQCFPEFIPLRDMDGAGRLQRNARRLHAGQVQGGEDYVVVVSSAAGLLGVNTGEVVRVLGGPEMRAGRLVLPVVARGPVVQLNGLGEGLREDALLEAVSNINAALNGHGVFIREALLGHVVSERLPYWVLEVSRPLREVDPGTLQSIAKRLHAELDLRSVSYRTAYRAAAMRPPQVHMVPMGTFAAAASGTVTLSQFDHSADASRCKKVLGVAWEQQMFEGV